FVSLAFLTGAALAAPAAAAPLTGPLADCIRTNAPRVEQAVPSLTDAVTFLTDHVCAVEIAEEANRRQVARAQAQADARKKECEQREASLPTHRPNACAEFGRPLPYTDLGLGPLLGAKVLPEANAMAAKVLLDLRLAHQ